MLFINSCIHVLVWRTLIAKPRPISYGLLVILDCMYVLLLRTTYLKTTRMINFIIGRSLRKIFHGKGCEWLFEVSPSDQIWGKYFQVAKRIKPCKIGVWLILDINKNSYMVRITVLLYYQIWLWIRYSNLEKRQLQGHLYLKSRRGIELKYIFL